jgi:predicted porin
MAGLRVGAAYAQQNNPYSSTNLGGATNSVSLPGSVVLVSTVPHRERQFGAGASYAFGPAVVGLAWTQGRVDNLADGAGSFRLNNYEVNARYNLTPALGLGIAYTYTNGGFDDFRFHANQFGLQGDYTLSKRTDVYAQGVYQVTSAGDGAAPAAVIDNGNVTGLSSSRRQAVASVGLRHRF